MLVTLKEKKKFLTCAKLSELFDIHDHIMFPKTLGI